jgi:putative addiction module killer protein
VSLGSRSGFRVLEYLVPDGRSPFAEWLDLLPLAARARVQARILRFEMGNLGDWKSVGSGVRESRLDYGPGYRVYFACAGKDLILLCGGDKTTQSRDIEAAKAFWKDYRRRETDERP